MNFSSTSAVTMQYQVDVFLLNHPEKEAIRSELLGTINLAREENGESTFETLSKAFDNVEFRLYGVDMFGMRPRLKAQFQVMQQDRRHLKAKERAKKFPSSKKVA